MNRNSNEQTIKEHIIKEYIKSYSRLPSIRVIDTEYRDYDADSKLYGLSNSHKPSAQANTEYSINKHLEDAVMLNLDYETLSKKQLSLTDDLERVFKTLSNTQKKHYDYLKKLELELSKEILLQSSSDAFTYGVVEDFKSNNNNIDFTKSNISLLDDGRVTLALNRMASTEFSNVSFDYFSNSTTHEIVDRQNLFNVKNILVEDGSVFQHVAYTRYQDSIVNLSLNLKFNKVDGENIDKLKIICRAGSGSAKTNFTVYYSTDFINYEKLDYDSNSEPINGSNYIDVYKDNVKDLRIIFSKRGYDYKRNNLFGYAFGIDFIGLTYAEYKVNEESYLYTKSYDIKDSDGNPYYFNFATIKDGTCCVIPEQSSVEFYLSKDNSNWYPCSIDNNGPAYVQFSNSDTSLHSLIINDAESPSLISNTYKSFSNLNVNYLNNVKNTFGITLEDDEAILNYYIPTANKSKFILDSLKIFRNVNVRYSLSGFEKVGESYKTSIFIKDRDGLWIDFGSQAININGQLKSGNTFLRYGLHSIVITQALTNNVKQLLNLRTSLYNLNSLKNFDDYYPYNHYLLLTGYSYPNNFSGERIYTNQNKVFRNMPKKVSNVKFKASPANDYSIYSIIENDSGLFFKIKKLSSDTALEAVDIEYKSNSMENPSNKLYVKAVLKSNNKNITPKIDSIKMRVV